MDLAWVLFSVLSQMAVGMALVLALAANVPGFALTGPVAEGPGAMRAGWMIVSVLMVVALGAAGYRQGGLAENWVAFTEKGLQWLSGPVQVYVFFLLLALWQVWREQPRLAVVTALVALLGLGMAAQEYRPELFSDTSSLLVFTVYLVTALSLGMAYTLRLVSEAGRAVVRRGLVVVLFAGLLLHTVLPVFSGSAWLEALSAIGSTRPSLVWVGLVCQFVVPLIALWRRGTLPDRVPWIMLFGAITLRMLFV